MRVAVHQPQYLPWSGLFDKIDRADRFVILDTVQYEKNEWQNRNRIKTTQGPLWLTVPVHYRFPQRIREVRVDDASGWRRKHWQTMTQSYRKAPFFDTYAGILEPLYRKPWHWLVDVNLAGMEQLGMALGLQWEPQLASEMTLSDEPSSRLVEICQQLGADCYVAGSGSHHYLKRTVFDDAGIAIEFQSFQPPTYPQLHGPFEPALSIVDMLLNCGPGTLAQLRTNRRATQQDASSSSINTGV